MSTSIRRYIVPLVDLIRILIQIVPKLKGRLSYRSPSRYQELVPVQKRSEGSGRRVVHHINPLPIAGLQCCYPSVEVITIEFSPFSLSFVRWGVTMPWFENAQDDTNLAVSAEAGLSHQWASGARVIASKAYSKALLRCNNGLIARHSFHSQGVRESNSSER